MFGWFLLTLAIALVAFAVGRRLGSKEGSVLARAAAPLILREQAYQTGKCPICEAFLNQKEAF